MSTWGDMPGDAAAGRYPPGAAFELDPAGRRGLAGGPAAAEAEPAPPAPPLERALANLRHALEHWRRCDCVPDPGALGDLIGAYLDALDADPGPREWRPDLEHTGGLEQLEGVPMYVRAELRLLAMLGYPPGDPLADGLRQLARDLEHKTGDASPFTDPSPETLAMLRAAADRLDRLDAEEANP